MSKKGKIERRKKKKGKKNIKCAQVSKKLRIDEEKEKTKCAKSRKLCKNERNKAGKVRHKRWIERRKKENGKARKRKMESMKCAQESRR